MGESWTASKGWWQQGQARIVAHEARYWSAANACVMQLQQAIG